MKQRFLSDLVSGIRGRVTLAAPPPRVYPHSLSNCISGDLPPSDGNSGFLKNHSQKSKKNFPRFGLSKFIGSSYFTQAVSVGILSLFVCSPSYADDEYEKVQSGIRIVEKSQTYPQGDINLGSSAFTAVKNDQVLQFTLQDSKLIFDMKRLSNVFIAKAYPTIVWDADKPHIGNIGVMSLVATHGGTLNIVGQPEGGSTLNITTKNNIPYFEQSRDLGGNSPVIFSIVSYTAETGHDSSLSINGVNLVLNHVASGIAADIYSKITGPAKSSIVINNDSIYILADQSTFTHHALHAGDGGSIDITSKTVNLVVSGTSTETSDPTAIYNAGIFEVYGGTITINSDTLSITVNTENKNPSHQNFGVYAIGQKNHEGNVTLSGKNLTVNVTGASKGYGLEAFGRHQSSSLSVNFDDEISIIVTPSATAPADKATTTGILINSYYSQDTPNGQVVTTEVNAGNQIYINAQKGIVIQSKLAENTSGVIDGGQNLVVDSTHYAVEGYSEDNAPGNLKIGAAKVLLSSADTGVSSEIAKQTGNDPTLLIDIQGTNSLTINAPMVAVGTGGYSTTNLNYSSGSDASTRESSINISEGNTLLNGSVAADTNAVINIGLNTATSVWTGFSQDNRSLLATKTDGKINVFAKSGATWFVQPVDIAKYQISGDTNKSYLTSWDSQGSSNINLLHDNGAYQAVDIGTLSGTNTTFWLATNIAAPRGEGLGTDQAIIHSGSGQNKIWVQSTGIGVEVPEQADFLIWHMEEDGATSTRIVDYQTGETEATGDNDLSFTLANEGGVVDAGIYLYRLATRDALNEEEGGTEWYLKRAEKKPEEPKPTPDPDPGPDPTPTPDPEPEYSPSTDVVRELAGFGAQYAIWWADLSDLRKRLGEVRYGAQDGAWARVITQKDDVSGVGYGGFTQKLYAVNIGIDHFAVQDEDRMWLLGGNFKYANANQRVKRSQYGKGDVHSWGMNLYATYANQYGCYSDFVLTYDHYQSKLHTRMLDNTPVGAKWNNYGYGASLEVGKMFSSTQNDEGWGPWYNHWWIEPQAQLAYYRIHGKSFTLSNGMKADPHNIDFLTGRLGVVIGKKFNYGKDRAVVDKRYSQFYIKGGIKHEFLGKQRLTVSDTVNEVTFKGNFRGTRVYYGGGFDWNFTDQLRLYAQIERENGGKYKKDYEISVGLKWQF